MEQIEKWTHWVLMRSDSYVKGGKSVYLTVTEMDLPTGTEVKLEAVLK
jgi:hypothetical protein